MRFLVDECVPYYMENYPGRSGTSHDETVFLFKHFFLDKAGNRAKIATSRLFVDTKLIYR